jgi:hypothetical protein
LLPDSIVQQATLSHSTGITVVSDYGRKNGRR